MYSDEIREMSDEDILYAIEDKKADLFQMRLNMATGELKDTNLLAAAKRDIARLKTVLRERELAAGGPRKLKRKKR